MTIALTGATGALGRLVVDALIERGTEPGGIVAVVRDPDRAADLAERGVQVRRAVYGDVPALTAAFQGVDRLLLISSSELQDRVAQHGSVVEAAQASGVAFLAYTSAPHADASSLPVAPDHAATEQLIRDSGIPSAFLRNNWYTENYAQTLQTAAATGAILTSAGDGRVASASRLDYAEGAAVVLAGSGHAGAVLELSGDVAWTPDDLAAAVSDVLGTPVRSQAVDADAHRAALEQAGLPAGVADFVVAIDSGIARGDLGDATGALAELIGRPTTPLLEGLRAVNG